MKRMLTILIHFNWLVFFAFHALGSLAGSLTFGGIMRAGQMSLSSGATGPMRAFPLVSAGLGTAALLVSVLFAWAFLNSIFGREADLIDGDVDKMAYGGGALVFSALSAIALVDADPAVLSTSTACFAALILSWIATRIEISGAMNAITVQKDTAPAVAQIMASAAAHPHRLAHIARRERN